MNKKVNLKSRQHLLDFDYLHKLNDSEKEWLNRFVEEEIHANFNHAGPILNKSKKQRKRIYDANNARNRDVYLKAQVAGLLEFTGSSQYTLPPKKGASTKDTDRTITKASVYDNSAWDDRKEED